ncbi:E3 ubiquitin-protein ligase ZNRF2 isoform X2 [Ambystoma mexicanum]|uniref:E3 ubiquitin-protein ligase ZNRF2 isoform X2 n=1 Tax=Ambystoma mexicanum TaxID=8296 RepID=UPI0037E87AFE
MGGKQSSHPASDGRTRAYSGSDIPSSSSSTTGNGTHRPTSSVRISGASASYNAPGRPMYATGVSHHQGTSGAAGAESISAPQHAHHGTRIRSLGVGTGGLSGGPSVGPRAQSSFNIPNSSSSGGGVGGTYNSSQDSGSSTPEEGGRSGSSQAGPRLLIGSLPSHLSPHLFGGFKCPVCSKFVSTDEMDLHLVMCLTKPRITYNEDVLTKDAGECAICLEELQQGDTIARLPCLCIYHKGSSCVFYTLNNVMEA